jgi:hypothetical protein
MEKIYTVRVASSSASSMVQVAGRRFNKSEDTLLHEHEMTGEIRNSALLQITVDGNSAQPADDEPGKPQSVEPSPFVVAPSELTVPVDSPIPEQPVEPDVQINTQDGISVPEASKASDVLIQRKREKKRK